MKQDKLVSILIPSYNVAPFIGEAIESIIHQTYSNIEILISDDGSSDNTFEIVQQYASNDSRIKVFRQSCNIGFVNNKNFLLDEAVGDFISFQDSDDVSELNRIQEQMRIVDSLGAKIVATGLSRLRNFSGVWRKVDHERVKDVRSGFIDNPSKDYPFMFATLLVAKKVYETIGYYHAYFNGLLGEDYYWTIRANEKWPIYFLAKDLYRYRENLCSTTNVFNIRKMVITTVLDELFRQRQRTGTDWLESNKMIEIAAFEKGLFNDKQFIGEKYRIWAAKAIDKNDFKLARKLLKESFYNNPNNTTFYTTLGYYVRRRWF
jgi:glycosyltransferase involved in cell wall biosynthesis